jgi:hypothetical protein
MQPVGRPTAADTFSEQGITTQPYDIKTIWSEDTIALMTHPVS